MKKQSISIAVVSEKRKANNEGLVPLKLRITHMRKQIFFSVRDKNGVPIWIEPDKFDDLYKQRVPSNLKPLKKYINDVESKAAEIIEKNFSNPDSFSFEAFRDIFFENPKPNVSQNIIYALKEKEKRLLSYGKISTASTYNNAANSITLFNKSDNLHFSKCTPAFLDKYEKWFIMDGKSLTTVGIYIRNVRCVFNEYISKGIITSDIYPFGKGKYEIPTGRNIKKALTLQDIKHILQYSFAAPQKNYYKDLWVFSYFCNGINIKDVALLKYKDIHDDMIYIERAKTSGKNRTDPKKIKIVMNEFVGKIIDTYGTKSDKYIFSIINADMSEIQKFNAIKQMVKNINKTMNEISDVLELPKITTYTARHSFATVLKRSGASVEFISESLGHKNLQTTENYLADFEIDTKRKWSNVLIPE